MDVVEDDHQRIRRGHRLEELACTPRDLPGVEGVSESPIAAAIRTAARSPSGASSRTACTSPICDTISWSGQYVIPSP